MSVKKIIMSRKVYHVVKTEDGWAGKARGGERVSVKGNTKAEVVARTAGIAKNYGNSQVVIHKMDGKIQSERTYGNDPFPPKG